MPVARNLCIYVRLCLISNYLCVYQFHRKVCALCFKYHPTQSEMSPEVLRRSGESLRESPRGLERVSGKAPEKAGQESFRWEKSHQAWTPRKENKGNSEQNDSWKVKWVPVLPKDMACESYTSNEQLEADHPGLKTSSTFKIIFFLDTLILFFLITEKNPCFIYSSD